MTTTLDDLAARLDRIEAALLMVLGGQGPPFWVGGGGADES
jgi:hypothetical protein